MYQVDRIVAVIKPTAKMLKWLRGQSSEFADSTLDDIREDCTALLLPVFEDPDTAEEFIEEIYLEIFENELALWDVDEDAWPQNPTLDTFFEWFDVEFHSTVIDLGDLDVIEQEPYSRRLQ